jgi:hypothetical protein
LDCLKPSLSTSVTSPGRGKSRELLSNMNCCSKS